MELTESHPVSLQQVLLVAVPLTHNGPCASLYALNQLRWPSYPIWAHVVKGSLPLNTVPGTRTVDTCESPVSPSIRNSWVILAAASAPEGSMDMGIHFPFIHHTCASRIGCHRHNPQHEDPRNYVSILISFQVNHKGSETSATHFRRYTSS